MQFLQPVVQALLVKITFLVTGGKFIRLGRRIRLPNDAIGVRIEKGFVWTKATLLLHRIHIFLQT